MTPNQHFSNIRSIHISDTGVTPLSSYSINRDIFLNF